MGTIVSCSACGKKYSFSSALAGKRVRCKQCGAVFPVPFTGGGGENLDLSAFDEPDHLGGSSMLASKHPPEREDEGPPAAADPEFPGMPKFESAEWSEPVSRAALRFSFPYAGEIDRFVPPLVVIGSLVWLILTTIDENDSQIGWISALRTGLLLLVFLLLVFPLTMVGTQIGARRMKYLLPHAARWRGFACYLPAFVIVAVIWQVGNGTMGSLFAGMVGALLVSLSLHVLLFRLRPDEIVESLSIAGGSFIAGVALAALLLLAINYFVRDGVVKGHRLREVPVSPIAVGLDWPPVPPPELASAMRPAAPQPAAPQPAAPSAPEAAPTETPSNTVNAAPAAGEQPAPAAETPARAPSGETPAQPSAGPAVVETPTTPPVTGAQPPAPQPAAPQASTPAQTPSTLFPNPQALATGTSPTVVSAAPVVAPTTAGGFIVSDSIAPLPADLDSLVYPATASPFVAVVRARDADGIPVEVWDTRTWTGQPAVSFAPIGEGENRFVLSPDGRLLARLVDFPHRSVQVWSFAEKRVVHTLPMDENVHDATLLGFADDRRLMLISTAGGTAGSSQLELWNTANETRVHEAGTPPVASECSTARALSPDGRLFAVATGHLEAAGRTRGDTPVSTPPQNVPGISIQVLDNFAAHNTRFAAWDQKYPVAPVGLSFSPDGTRVVLLFEQGGTGLISCYHTDGVYRPISEYSFPGSPVPGRGVGKPFVGSAIEWLTGDARNSMWLLYGQRIIDAATGAAVADLPTKDALQQHISGNTVQVLVGTADGHKSLRTMQLDLGKLAAAAGTAH